jgi:hypothetical protein
LIKIGMPHLSLVEAIEAGQVAELSCLKEDVGAATAFFSHVQILPLATTLLSLEHAESMYEKELGKEPLFFLDYANIRQCLGNDFTTARVVEAIQTIGITVVELDSDFHGVSAMLRRIFCVLESFATVKARGCKLLVCGPALRDAATTVELARIASDSIRCKEIMDSETSQTRSAVAEAMIKQYIVQSVGFARLDRVVLGAIVDSCVRSAAAVFAAMDDGGASVLQGVGNMLFEVEETTQVA